MQMLDEAVEAAARGWRRGRGLGAGPARRQRRRLRPARLHPLRAGQGRRPPPDRRRARGRRSRAPARRARGPLRRAPRAAAQPDPRSSRRGSSSARPAPRAVSFRGGRLAVTPIELDSVRAKRVARRDPRGALRVRQVAAVDARARRSRAALPGRRTCGRRAACGYARGGVGHRMVVALLSQRRFARPPASAAGHRQRRSSPAPATPRRPSVAPASADR